MSTGEFVGHSITPGSTSLILAEGSTTPNSLADRFGWFYYADDHGVKPDGSDIYAAMKALCTKVNLAGGGKIVLRHGTYTCSARKTAANGFTNFDFTDCTNGVVIEGNGARFEMNGAYTRSATTDNTVGFDFRRVAGVIIRDLELDGNNDQTTFGAGEGLSHGLSIMGCTDIRLDNVRAHHFPMDGFLFRDDGAIGTTVINKRGVLTNCVADYNGRQGASFTGARWFTCIGCNFTNTGRSSYAGHAPKAGVDIEPDAFPGLFAASGGAGKSADDYGGDIQFLNCLFKNNAGSEFVSSGAWNATYSIPGGSQYPITAIGCRFEGAVGAGSRVMPTTRFTRFTNCMFKDLEVKPNFGGAEVSNEDNAFDRCVFENADPAMSPIRWIRTGVGAATAPTLRVNGCEFRFTAPSAVSVTARIYLVATVGGAVLEFKHNKVVVAGTEHDGVGTDTTALLNGGQVADNEWQSDLNVGGGQFFFIDYANADAFNERYVSASAFSPTGAVFADPVFSKGTVAIGGLEVGDGTWTATKRKIVFGNNTPPAAAGVQYQKGDTWINSNPANSSAAWGGMCTTAGIAGAAVWTTFHPIGMVQSAAQADSVAADVATLKTDFNGFLAKLRTAKLLAP